MEPAAILHHIVQMLLQQANGSPLEKERVGAKARDAIMAADVPPVSAASVNMVAPLVCAGPVSPGRGQRL